MTRPLALLALPILVVGLAAADKAPPPKALEPAFTGTIVSTYPDGRIGKLWLDRSGDYVAEGRRKDRSSGHWTVKDDKVCLKQSKPLPVPMSYCTPMPSGAAWSAKAVSGEPIQVKVVKGRAGR